MPKGTCRLCDTESELQLSHILPAFAIRWLRESSGTGHVRGTAAPNLRVQDGEKRHLLFTHTLMVYRLSSIMVRGFCAFAFQYPGESCSFESKKHP